MSRAIVFMPCHCEQSADTEPSRLGQMIESQVDIPADQPSGHEARRRQALALARMLHSTLPLLLDPSETEANLAGDGGRYIGPAYAGFKAVVEARLRFTSDTFRYDGGSTSYTLKTSDGSREAVSCEGR